MSGASLTARDKSPSSLITLRTVRLRTAYRGLDDDHPAVTNLDSVLLDAVRAAAVDAATRYSSQAETARWVAAAEHRRM